MLDEAFRELELEPGASKADVRKAYLRLVKSRSPEADPEGFKRLRAAFDRLNEVGDLLEQIAKRAHDARPAAPLPDHLRPYPVTEERVEAPGDTAPGDTAPGDTATVAPANVAASIQGAIDRADWAEAARIACEEIAAADREVRPFAVPPRALVELALKMRVERAHASAQRVTKALAASVDQSGDVHAFGSGFVPWSVARELAELGSALSSDAKVVIARATLGEPAQRTRRELRRLANAEGRKLRSVLFDAPTLWELYGSQMVFPKPGVIPDDPTLQAPHPPPRRSMPNKGWFAGGGIFVVFAVLRLISGACRGSSREISAPAAYRGPTSYVELGPATIGPDESLGKLDAALSLRDCATARSVLASIPAEWRAQEKVFQREARIARECGSASGSGSGEAAQAGTTGR